MKIAERQLTLGQLIELVSGVEPDLSLRYDFGSLVPCGISSYRGYYEDLAVGYGEANVVSEMSAKKFLEMLKGAFKVTFSGYKGGSYTMDRDTALWVANYGMSSNTIITGVDRHYSALVLRTGWQPH